ncbi:MAG: hypothetical protein WDO06_02880 [Actinomycetota bacterium]
MEAPLDQWSEFFIAGAGAAAALAGLVIVAVSVNVREILKYRSLPSRSAATIGSLTMILVACMAGPYQRSKSAGIWNRDSGLHDCYLVTDISSFFSSAT